MAYPLPVEEHADPSDFPQLDFDGKMFLKEIEYQIFDNPNWSNFERQWWNMLRNKFLGCVMSYEDATKEAYMRGVEFGQQSWDESA